MRFHGVSTDHFLSVFIDFTISIYFAASSSLSDGKIYIFCEPKFHGLNIFLGTKMHLLAFSHSIALSLHSPSQFCLGSYPVGHVISSHSFVLVFHHHQCVCVDCGERDICISEQLTHKKPLMVFHLISTDKKKGLRTTQSRYGNIFPKIRIYFVCMGLRG